MKPATLVLVVIISIAVIYIVYTVSPHTYQNGGKENFSPIIEEVRKRFAQIKPEYGDIPISAGNKSFTENKSEITLCLIDSSPRKCTYSSSNPNTCGIGEQCQRGGKCAYTINTIMYVALHELSHVITPYSDGDHGPVFRKNFENLLAEAAKKDLYDPRLPIPHDYCGIDEE